MTVVKKRIMLTLKFISYKLIKLLPGATLKSVMLSALHAIFMIFISLFWLSYDNRYDGFELMSEVIDYRDFLQYNVFKKNIHSELGEKYLLLNTSRNNQILALDNDKLINEIIVDRKELARVLNILDRNSHKIRYVICDVFIEREDGINDHELKDVMQRLHEKQLIVLSHYIPDNGPQNKSYNIFNNVNTGLAQYKSSFLNLQYLKFSYIFENKYKQVPLIAYEEISGSKMKINKFLGVTYFSIDGKWVLNTTIPPFRYRPFHLIRDNNYFDLGLFEEYNIKNQSIVLIGDFEGSRDVHHTIVEKVSGTLILLNAMESLFQGDNIINWHLLLLLFVFFHVISYYTFYNNRVMEKITQNTERSKVYLFILKRMNYFLILILTLILMMFFHFYLNLYILLTYFIIISNISHLFIYIKNKRMIEKMN